MNANRTPNAAAPVAKTHDRDASLRFGTASTPQSLRQKVDAILAGHGLSYDIQWTLSGLPFLTAEGPLTEAARRAVAATLGYEPALSTGGGTSDGRFIAPTGAQVVELGPVNSTIHKANERIAVGDPARLSRVYQRLLAELLESRP